MKSSLEMEDVERIFGVGNLRFHKEEEYGVIERFIGNYFHG
jgi:hypothetical protein